jgi:menaquinone-9 beta-reductase
VEVNMTQTETDTETDTDVIVVGAGPGGSATAYHLAKHGVRVLLLEKAEFPREKVCGDGLTPRAVKQLVDMGIDVSPEAGWLRNKGLRVIGGGMRLELDWPQLASYPDFGLVRTRLDFDDMLAKQAVKAGATLKTGHNVTGAIFDETGRLTGVKVKTPDGEPDGEKEFRAPLIVAADGVSGRIALSLGMAKRDDRPMGVAVRRYYRCAAKADDEYLESWLELRSRDGGDKLLPGYGWIFGLGDGRVNVGLGVLNSSKAYQQTNYREMLLDWLGATPVEWGLGDEANADGKILGAALPMGFNRTPHYTRGLMLVGDCGGMVNPFNGEGIAYAMESGQLAAEVAIQALARPAGGKRELALRAYPTELRRRFGGYYRLGTVFVKAIGNPNIMKLATQHGLPHPTLMRFVLKLLANLTDPRGGDAMDRIINAMSRVAPAV